jgi:hypothetical protein
MGSSTIETLLIQDASCLKDFVWLDWEDVLAELSGTSRWKPATFPCYQRGRLDVSGTKIEPLLSIAVVAGEGISGLPTSVPDGANIDIEITFGPRGNIGQGFLREKAGSA